MLNFFLIVNA